MKAHSYPFYVDDWYAKETWLSMTCEERGIFRELLDHAYQEGSLPASLDVLQRRSGATEAEWQRSRGKVLARFIEEDGRLKHRKVEEIRERLLEWREQKADAGRRSVKARRERTLERDLNGRSNVRLNERSNETSTDVQTHVQTHVQTYVQTELERTFKPCLLYTSPSPRD